MNIKKSKVLESTVVSLAIIVVFSFIYLKYSSSILTILFGTVLLLLNILVILFPKRMENIFNKIIKYRYIIALIVFIFCIIFKLHGSSIGIYNNVFDDSKTTDNNIFGVSRIIRGDEFIVHTPYYFSQRYNNYKKTSHQMSLTGQDMIVGYDAPVKDITLIAKPFTWGYFLLGNERGLSWYWCSKLILLILVSFETCMIITKKNQKVSCLGSLLIAFGPAMQWWFVPHMCDVFFWAMALFTTAYHTITQKKTTMKLLMSVLLACSSVTFVIALFPSLQVPTGLLFLALLSVCLYRDKENINMKKKDIIRLIIIGIIALMIIVYTIIDSKDAILILLNTVYPGKRISLGNTSIFADAFTNLTTIFLPYKSSNVLNNCEVSTFIHFAPLFIALFPSITKKINNNDSNYIVGKVLIIILIIEMIFMFMGFPEILARMTLFSYINRMSIVYGFTAVLYCIWFISIVWTNKKQIIGNKMITFSCLLYGLVYFTLISKENIEYLPLYVYIAEIILFVFISFCILKRYKYLTVGLLSCVIIFASFTINPIVSGTGALTNQKLSKVILKTSKKDNGNWLSVTTNEEEAYLSDWMASLVIANGGKDINAVNFYPDFKKWKILDSKKNYSDIYNRYAHIYILLTDAQTTISSPSVDVVIVSLNYNDLKKLPITYLMINNDISVDLENHNISYQKIETNTKKYFIYKIKLE